MNLINNFIKKIKYEKDKINLCNNCRHFGLDSIYCEPKCYLKRKPIKNNIQAIKCNQYKEIIKHD